MTPDYSAAFARRARSLAWLRSDDTGERLTRVKAFYVDHPTDFINDWGCTFDPRLAARGLPTIVPFLLWPKQRAWCDWVMTMWATQESGLTEKTRDWGVSWLAMALSCTLCSFREGLSIGFGSRKEEYVDRIGSPRSLFAKGRQFIELLPPEFKPGWKPSDTPHLRMAFNWTGSAITGEAGDNIGRGDRSSIYFTDEEAFIERPHLVEAALSQTTDCRISISTPKGMDNPFATKRFSWPTHRIFICDWRDDPRKGEEWYAKQQRDLDAVTLAQEVDRSYTASVSNIVIQQDWVQACIDAHVKLGFEPRGQRRGALDVADEGVDLNAFAAGQGILLESVVGWSGKGSDPFATTQRTFAFCDVLRLEEFEFDSDGLGVSVRGDARVLNEGRKHKIGVHPYRGSGSVVDPNKPIEDASPMNEKKDPGEIVRLNEDYFENFKAQSWFSLRARAQRTFRALQMRGDWRDAYKQDDLMSISSKMPELGVLSQQLSQAVFTQSKAGKMLIVKTPDGARSPNHGDAAVIFYAPRKRKGSYRLAAWSS